MLNNFKESNFNFSILKRKNELILTELTLNNFNCNCSYIKFINLCPIE